MDLLDRTSPSFAEVTQKHFSCRLLLRGDAEHTERQRILVQPTVVAKAHALNARIVGVLLSALLLHPIPNDF